MFIRNTCNVCGQFLILSVTTLASKMRAIDRSRSGESQLTEIHKVLTLAVQAVKKKLTEVKTGAPVPLGPRAARESTQKHCWGVPWQCLMKFIAKISRGG